MWIEKQVLQINLGKLKNKNEIITNYLEEKLGIKTSQEGNLILLDDNKYKIKKKDIKLYLKKFLYREGLKTNSRILIDNDTIHIIELVKK